MTELFDAADLLCKVRRRLRFGTVSREPLRLLRLEWKGTSVECDWLMRPADPWDRLIPEHLAEEHETLESLRDALSLRDIVFETFPKIVRADLRMFRTESENRLELMMTGSVNRSDDVLRRVPSVAMRAKLCGFRFTLASGVLESMNTVSMGFF